MEKKAPAPIRRAKHPAQPAESAASTGRTDPVPIRRASPELGRDVQAEIRQARGKVSVSVLASIDRSGIVQSVKVLSSTGEPSPSGPYIRLAALNAARQWKFRPATAEGRAISSQMTLVFNF
jgi:TonB family protein